MITAIEGHVEACRLLVYAGSNVKLSNKSRETAILLSQLNQNCEHFEKVMLEFAIEKGNCNAGDFYALYLHFGILKEKKVNISGNCLPFEGELNLANLSSILGKSFRVVNGALEYLETDLGITENTVARQVFGFQIDYGIPIESWFDDRSDKELLTLLPFLESLVRVEDVRPLIAKKINLREKIAAEVCSDWNLVKNLRAECFTELIHEDIVFASRRQIESGNPLAFAPKVIRSSDSLTEVGNELEHDAIRVVLDAPLAIDIKGVANCSRKSRPGETKQWRIYGRKLIEAQEMEMEVMMMPSSSVVPVDVNFDSISTPLDISTPSSAECFDTFIFCPNKPNLRIHHLR
ncbi:hypothetical protein ACH5RR_000873 [Cinchona calisaya]|uniref:FCP1 homology domain-containing protein n=1 Tax=Cinchona calisaya TaxID=153742 RepID=A0ABD3B300_9GENT